MSFNADKFLSELEKEKKKKKQYEYNGSLYSPSAKSSIWDDENFPIRTTVSNVKDDDSTGFSTEKFFAELGSLTKKEEQKDKYQRLRKSTEKNKAAMEEAAEEVLSRKKANTWLDAGAFSDGYNFGDITRTLLGTGNDIGENITSALIDSTENVLDTAIYGTTYAAKKFGLASNENANKILGFIAEDQFKSEKTGEKVFNAASWGTPVGLLSKALLKGDTEEYSVLGEKSDGVIQSGTQLAEAIGLSFLGLPPSVTMGVNAFGGQLEKAANDGANFDQAGLSAGISAVSEVLFEKISGGIVSKTGLDDVLTKPLVNKISNKFARSFLKFTGKTVLEGVEEPLTEAAGKFGEWLTYRKDEESLKEVLLSDEAIDDYITSFIGGMLLGGTGQGVEVGTSHSKGVDYVTGLTSNEEAVVKRVYDDRLAEAEKKGKVTLRDKNAIYDKIVEEMKRGEIPTDTIEEVLGGETYKTYKATIDSENALKEQQKALEVEIEKIGNGDSTPATNYKYGELQKQLSEVKSKLETATNDPQRKVLKAQLSKDVYELTKGDRLRESYFERVRAEQKFTADLNKYKGKARDVIKQVMDSKLVDNTNKSHEFWDWVANISAKTDRGISIASNDQILEMVKAEHKELGLEFDESKFEGQLIDGYTSKNGIFINAETKRALNFVVGHEITHNMEGTKHYEDLQKILFEFNKGEYESRYNLRAVQYGNKFAADEKFKSKVDKEVAADLVGDLLFTDKNFITHLATTNKSVFRKIYDELVYLYKIATAGSEQSKQLEKIKREFTRAWREINKAQTDSSGVKHSLSETTDGRFVAVVDSDILSNIDTSSWDNIKKAEAKKAATDALKKFSGGIVVDGITHKVNKVSRREYTRSNYTESLYNNAPDVFADKMRAADIAGDIVVATTNWVRDGGLQHPRNDNFVDFDHGKTLILSGNTKYIAEVVVGITDKGEAVLYDVVDMTPTNFDIKKDESPTTATTQNAIGDIQGDSSADNVAQEGKNVNTKYSLAAIEKFGTTTNFNRAGFVVNDGRMLNLSRYGQDGVQHKIIEGVYENVKGNDAVIQFLQEGNVRMNANSPGIEIGTAVAPTVSQLNTISRFINDSLAKKGVFYLDITDTNGNNVASIDYDEDSSVSDIIYDIKEYYESGRIPKQPNRSNLFYSVSDSNGRQLPAETQERLQYSVIRDENGKLKPMYHGSPNGSVTSFKAGTYFTDNKEYADRYQNTGASSISTGKVAANPKTYEVYLDIRKPFDLNDAEARNIYINEYIKGGNALGINPYMSDADYAKITAIDWTEGEDLRDFLIDNGYDYDGLVLDEGADGGYGEEVKYRGKSYMIFDPEQVVNVAPDVRFSLSNAVEESNDLMAIHNLHTNELLKQLEMGGMVYPSVAVTNPALISHDDFGEISAILRKDAIDPEKNKYNHLYSSDAYTPTFPHISYEANRDVAESISNRIKEQFDKLPDYYQRSIRSFRDYTNLNDILNRWGGMQGLIDSFADDHGMKQVYLAEKGENVPMEIERTETQLTDYQKALYQNVVDRIGTDALEALNDKGNYNTLGEARIAWTKEHLEVLKDIYAEDWAADGTMTKAEALEIANEQKLFYWYKEAVSALEYMDNGGVKVVEKEDYNATNAKIDEKTKDSDYKQWLADLFNGIEGQSGLRNSKDTFLPSGKRRSFSQLHDPVTIDNVIKAMRKKDQTGQGGVGTNFGGASVQEYGSIAEAKRNANMLGVIDDAEYKVIKQQIDDKLLDIALRYAAGKDIIDAKNTLAEAVSKNESKAGIARYLKQFDYVFKYTDEIADDIIELRDYVRSLPRPYFEAKPRRAVGFDEVAVFVIPYDADVKLKQELLNRGYSIAEYDPKIEGDRQRVVNQFEEYKFSLSNIGDTPKKYGNYNVYAKDILLDKGDIAPVQEAVEQPVQGEVAPANDLFPDDLAPVQEELDNLQQQKEILENKMQEAIKAEDIDTFTQINYEYDAVLARIDEIVADDADRLSTLDESDMPPEMDAPYPGEPTTTPDPFAERDMSEVGNRKVKAYMYENPEVKPFFQEAARVMLGDLGSTVRGERFYSDEVVRKWGNERAWTGVSRQTTDDIADLLDNWNYSYDQIEKGLQAIIEDNGKENNAVSKRIEFMLDDRLRNGYKDVWGEPMPANPDYINLLKEKQINEYSKEAFDSFMQTADRYAPPVEEDIALVATTEESSNVQADIAPTTTALGSKEVSGQQTFIKDNATYDALPSDDIAQPFEVNGKKGVPEGQQAFLEPAADIPTRKELHQSIIDNAKNVFRARGFDLDAVFKNAKDLSTFATVDNTPQRVMEKALGYKEGGILADLTVNKVAQNETQGIKWLNSFTDKKTGLLAQISKQYNIKPGSKESAAAQMYAEGFYVDDNNNIIKYGDDELAKDFPNATVQKNVKGLAGDQRIRRIYDETLAAINESRSRNAYPEIPRLDNYFLHFRAMDDTFSRLGLPFNPNDIRAKDLPTDLNGVTADLKPGQPYFSSAMHRKGKRTSFDLLGGLERYLTSAKDQIYHIDDIQTLRALRNYIADTYGQANGLEGLDELSEEAAQERIEQVYNSHLSTFAKFLNEEANVLAGKTALIDRGIEGIIGRRGITFINTVNKQVGSNMVGFNVSSSLTNFIPVAQTFAKSNKADFVKAFGQTVANKVGSIFGNGIDSFAENSPVIIRRKGAERFYRTPFQKIGDVGYTLMSAVDDISTELIARTKYNELTRNGMNSQKAHYETDKWVSRLMGDRSLGQQPHLYNSKMLGLFTKFQLEVRNQLDSQFYDTIQEAKVSNEHIQSRLARNAKTAAKITSTFFQLAIAQHLFGKAFESIAGYNPAFDIISAMLKLFGFDDEEDSEDTALDNVEQAFFELMGDMPYVSTFSGGRIPISAALPIKELYNGEDQYGNEKSRWETLKEAAPYYLLPGGYGQAKKTAQGLSMFDDDLPIAGSYTDSGNLRFPVEDTLGNRIQAGIFGQWASENARDYFDNERKPLNEKQTQEFIDVDIPIRDYWEYREGLSGLKTTEEKADYINSLDLPIDTKNILVNNILDRKEPIDLEEYGRYSSFEEFDFAEKNPEKYAFFNRNGISYSDYASADEDLKRTYTWAYNNPEKYDFLKENGVSLEDYSGFDDEAKDAYSWAYNNPDKYTLSKAVANDLLTYRQYTSDLYNIKADKDANGKSISGSRKTKVIDYINNLDADYGEKIILFKSEYPSDDTYNYEIIDYLNSRDDISYSEMETILKELGFTVKADGTIYWD